MQLQITNICLIHIEILFIICENITVKQLLNQHSKTLGELCSKKGKKKVPGVLQAAAKAIISLTH